MNRACEKRGQDVAIPELDALRAYRAQFVGLIKQLDLPPPPGDDDDTDDGTGLPMCRSEAGRRGAVARWSARYGY